MNQSINLSQYDVLILDCWDTILHRPVVFPHDLFHFVPGGPSIAKRGRMEEEARVANFVKKNHFDVTMSKHFDMSAEYAFEKESAFRSISNEALAGEFIRRGKKVIIVSDTYLSEPELAELLKGFPFTAIVCSCSAGKMKAQGLIADIVRQLQVHPKKVIVIGDNPHADQAGANLVGADSRVYSGYSQSLLRKLIKTDELTKEYLNRPMWAPHKKQLLEKQFDDPYYELGYSVLGPLIAGTLHRIKTDEMLTFAARDAWLFYDLYDGKKQYFACNRELAWRASIVTEEDKRDCVGHFWANPFAGEHILKGDYEKTRNDLKRHIATLEGPLKVFDLGYVGMIFHRLAKVGIETEPTFLIKHASSYFPAITDFNEGILDRIVMNKVPVLETLCKQPVGALEGWDEAGAPIFKEAKESTQSKIVSVIQQGARDFVRDAGVNTQDVEAHLLYLLMGKDPVLQGLYHEFGLNTDKVFSTNVAQ